MQQQHYKLNCRYYIDVIISSTYNCYAYQLRNKLYRNIIEFRSILLVNVGIGEKGQDLARKSSFWPKRHESCQKRYNLARKHSISPKRIVSRQNLHIFARKNTISPKTILFRQKLQILAKNCRFSPKQIFPILNTPKSIRYGAYIPMLLKHLLPFINPTIFLISRNANSHKQSIYFINN